MVGENSCSGAGRNVLHDPPRRRGAAFRVAPRAGEAAFRLASGAWPSPRLRFQRPSGDFDESLLTGRNNEGVDEGIPRAIAGRNKFLNRIHMTDGQTDEAPFEKRSNCSPAAPLAASNDIFGE